MKVARYFKAYGHYIPMVFFTVMYISLIFIRHFNKIDIPIWITSAIQVCLGFSFVYTSTKEAKKFQSKGKWGSVYRTMFGAGVVCCMFIFDAVLNLFGF